MSAKGHKILLVEDEPDQVLLLKHAFQKADVVIPIQIFRDGQEVMDYLTKIGTDPQTVSSDSAPTLMLLDLKMPRKTGFEVLEWLRHQSRWKHLIVVVMANSLHPSDIARAYELGCNSYVSKPVQIEDIVELARMIYRYWLQFNITTDLQITGNRVGSASAGVTGFQFVR